MASKSKRGRPSKLTEELFQEILNRLYEGESGRSICRSKHMPDWRNLCRWRQDNEHFRHHYAIAREAGLELKAEEMQEIADDSSKDVVYTEILDKAGNVVMRKPQSDNTGVNRARLRVDTLKWTLSKLIPKKYGDRIETEQKITINHEYVDRPPIEDFESWKKRVEERNSKIKPELVN